jgi:hypothetical protein
VRSSVKYTASAIGVVALGTLLLWPWLGEQDRGGVVIAALIALPVQVPAFCLLLRFRRRMNGFLAVWLGGTLVRMGVILVVATVAVRTDANGAVAMLLALAGFFFALLLLEPVYFRPEAPEVVGAS